MFVKKNILLHELTWSVLSFTSASLRFILATCSHTNESMTAKFEYPMGAKYAKSPQLHFHLASMCKDDKCNKVMTLQIISMCVIESNQLMIVIQYKSHMHDLFNRVYMFYLVWVFVAVIILATAIPSLENVREQVFKQLADINQIKRDEKTCRAATKCSNIKSTFTVLFLNVRYSVSW